MPGDIGWADHTENLMASYRSAHPHPIPLGATGNGCNRGLPHNERTVMARRHSKVQAEFVLFDVLYADGTRTSNRKVPSAVLGGLEGDEPAREIIEAQDRQIAERSGRTRGPIELITRAAANSNAK